jgi:outer membrane scaffolding protein for murein synthesis (MipA/OmpV family)
MKKLVMMAVAMVAVATTVSADGTNAAPVVAKEESKCPLSFAATLDIYSAYVWRGNVINDRPVWQPGATVSYATKDYGTLSANVWQNWDLTDRNNHRVAGGLNESDYTLSYTKDLGPIGVEIGHIWYTFPKLGGKNADGKNYYAQGTEEVYGGLAYNNDYITPFIKVYGDYDAAKSLYGTFGLRKSVSVTDRLTVGSSASLGAGNAHYMEYYFADDDAELVDGNLSVNTSYALTDHISVGATLAWMSILDKSARHSVEDADWYFGKQDSLWGGLNLAASF